MVTARKAFFHSKPGTRRPIGYRPGDHVPDDVVDLVDVAVLNFDEDDADVPSPEPTVDKSDDDSDDDLDDLDDLDADDAADDDDEPAADEDLFDPDTASAKKVLEHLESSDEAEYERVVAAEKAGQARPTIVGR